MNLLLLGTRNEGKIRELLALLDDLDEIELLTFHKRFFRPVEETGKTFRENALLKARAISVQTGLPVLAEDAGLQVVALGNEPGVFSARYAGPPISYERNNSLLLERLADAKDRRASFVAVAALHLPDGREHTCRGTLRGSIAHLPAGDGGFGYDPLFVPDGFKKTLAQIPVADKNRISHRRRSIDLMKGFIASLDWSYSSSSDSTC